MKFSGGGGGGLGSVGGGKGGADVGASGRILKEGVRAFSDAFLLISTIAGLSGGSGGD